MLEMAGKCSNYARNGGLCFSFWIMLFEADYAKNYASIFIVSMPSRASVDTAGPGGKPKWLQMNFGFNVAMRAAPILSKISGKLLSWFKRSIERERSFSDTHTKTSRHYDFRVVIAGMLPLPKSPSSCHDMAILITWGHALELRCSRTM